MCYLTLVDTILKLEQLNWCIIHILEISSLASQNWLQDPRPQHIYVYIVKSHIVVMILAY